MGDWPATLSDTSVGLHPGESTTIEVAVDIPADASGSENHFVSVVSVGDNSETEALVLTTTASIQYIFLPGTCLRGAR